MRLIKKNDLWLILTVLGVSVLLMCVRKVTSKEGARVIIYLNNENYAECTLADDSTIEIVDCGKVKNIVCIENGYAMMKEADCPDGLCLMQQKICRAGESICCLPNRVYIEVKSQEHKEYDAITQ